MAGSPGGWTNEQLEAFGDDALVVALSREAQAVPPPTELADVPVVPGAEQEWVDMLSLVRLAHRGHVVRAWWESHESPGEVVECEVTADVPGMEHPRHQRLRFANLLDDPAVGAILLSVVDLGPAAEPTEAEPIGSQTYQAPSWAISYIDGVGTVLSVDGMVVELYGRTADELIGGNVIQTVHPEARDVGLNMWMEVVGEVGSTRTFQHRTLHPDGTTLWIESTVMNRLLPGGSGSVVVVSHDIEERRRELAALRESQEQFRMLAHDVPAGVFRANRWGRVEFGNERWHQLVDREQPVERLHDIVDPDDREAFSAAWSQLFSEAHDGEDEASVIEIRAADGDRVLSLSCRVTGDRDGRSTVIGAMYDVTATNELQYRADHDALTGLPNRRAFDRRLAEVLAGATTDVDPLPSARREPTADEPGPAVFFVDLDGFKPVNDQFGHEVGDIVLGTVGQRLRSALRPGDIVARYGGDEFVVLCMAVPLDGEQVVVRRIERVLASPIAWEGGAWVPRASIGVARPVSGDKPETILRRADQSMYDAKRAGRT